MKKWLALAVCAASASTVWSGEAQVVSTGDAFRFGHHDAQLTIDRATGRILAATKPGSGASVLLAADAAPAVDILVGGQWLLANGGMGRLRYKSHRLTQHRAGATFEIVSALGPWDVCSRFALHPDGAIVRTAEFAYHGPAPGERTVVRVPRFWLRGLCIGEPGDTTVTVLADYPPVTKRLSDLVERPRRSPRMSSATARAVLLRNEKLGLSLAAAFYSDSEHANLFVHERPNAVDLCHELYAQDVLRPGLRLEAGSQILRIVSGSRQDALRAIQGFYDTLGVGKPAHSPADAPQAVIYSAHPGGTIDSGFRDCGGFSNFAKLIPRIHDLGCNTIWLMPFWYGRVYAPYDYYRLDPKQGTPADLKALCDEAHKRGMRVLGDLIPHGPRDELGFHKEHPDWICRDEQGEMIYWWGCLYCDYANPGWQQYMADHAAHWVRTCGLDGYRVDVAGGGPPNWRPFAANRPSYSGLWGGLRLMDKARREVAKHNPNAIWLAESHGTHWYAFAEYAYDWAFSSICAEHAIRQSPGDWCHDALQYLEYQKYAFPEHAYPLRFLTNHDQIRARMRYGVGLHRAMLALCALAKGVPFLYHEQEVGDEWFIRRLYEIRAKYEELVTGEPHYLAVQAQPEGVMALLRKLGRDSSVVAINFHNRPVTARLGLPTKLLGIDANESVGLFEAFRRTRLKTGDSTQWSRDQLGDVLVDLGPYEPAVIVVRPEDQLPQDEPQPKAPPQPKGVKPRVTRSGDTVRIDNGHYVAVIDGARGGLLTHLGPPAGKSLLREVAFRESRRKLFIGVDPIDFAQTQAQVRAADHRGFCVVSAKGQVTRAGGQPVLKYEHHYNLTPDQLTRAGPQAGALWWTCTLEPLIDLGPAQTDLALRLRFRPTSHWFANTAEGWLSGACLFRHPFPGRFVGRYWHGSGEAFYQSGLYPLHPSAPMFGVFDEPATALIVHGPVMHDGERPGLRAWWRLALPPLAEEQSHGVAIVEDKANDSPREIGGPAAATAVMTPYSPYKPVVLRRGEKIGFTVAFQLGPRDGLRKRPAATAPPRAFAGRGRADGGRLSTHGPNYMLRVGDLEAVACRSAGGALRSVSWRGQASLITDSRFYTDYGLYDEWRDPLGREHKMCAHNSQDPEPDAVLRQGNRVEFTSFFRHPYAGGRSLLNPRMQYHVAYQSGQDGKLRVEAGVRPMMTKVQASAFLAQTVSMQDVDEWAADDGPWQKLPPRKDTGRLWESAVHGRLPKAFAVRDTSTSRSVRFSDFAAGDDVQNVFLLGGGKRAVLFVAFLSGTPVDVAPAWRRATYAIQPGGRE